jgi:RNA polymerase sigma-70 factor (ECF subfamily)
VYLPGILAATASLILCTVLPFLPGGYDRLAVPWRERAQFFAMAARMMRRILVDAARARNSRKRGSGAIHVNFEETAVLAPEPDRSMIALDEALAAFSEIGARQAKVVDLR